jgi:hypothetical protein
MESNRNHAQPGKETELGKLPGVILLALDVTNPAQVKEIVEKAIDLVDRGSIQQCWLWHGWSTGSIQ